MSGCSGKCDSCKPSGGVSVKPKGRNTKEEDIKNFLKSPHKQKEDGSNLNGRCGHYHFGDIQRWQCDVCIVEWVAAQDDESVKEAIDSFKLNNKSVTSERIRNAFKEKVWKRKIK